MRKLDRNGVARPCCLDTYDHNTQSWDDLGAQCKKNLRAALFEMQGIPGINSPDAKEYGLRCAYCESAIYHEGHIEHFRRKNKAHFPQLTFDWQNLFLACGSHHHCGHYKDRKAAPPYDPNLLIKPDVDDPSEFLHFHSSGEVRVRSGLQQHEIERAEATIRVFGLDKPQLNGARAKSVSSYRKLVNKDLNELESWPADLRCEYIAGEISSAKRAPHSATIRDFLETHL